MLMPLAHVLCALNRAKAAQWVLFSNTTLADAAFAAEHR